MDTIISDEIDQDTFLSDLRFTLASSQRHVLIAAIDRVEAALRRRTEAALKDLAKEIAETVGCSEQEAFSVLSCVGYLATRTIDAAPDVNTSVKDIQELALSSGKGLEPDEATQLAELLEAFANEADEWRKSEIEYHVIRGVLPMFNDLQATIELRSTRPALLSVDEAESLRLNLVPVASLRLSLDSGEPNGIGFQATDEDLAVMQRQIEKLRKEMKALKERVQLK
jgi:hypothetical protein